jgi:AraC-like DNA-binding protein
VDALTSLIDGTRSRGTALLRVVVDPPFAIRVEDRAPITLLAPMRGSAWLLPDDAAPHRLDAGDVAVVRGPDPYIVADPPDAPIGAVIHPDNRSTTPTGDGLCDVMDLGVRSWGDRPDGETLLLVGTYRTPGEIALPLLSALPPVLVLSAADWDCPYLPLLARETARDVPGQDAVLGRLLDVLFVEAVRTWFARPESPAPAWYRAQADPVVGRVLTLMHDDPAHPWTLAELARSAGTSRAGLARRFLSLVGEPPMSHLTNWRVALAADLLREPGSTLASVARQVGYGSPFALSAAFKRVRGISPDGFRRGIA